MRFKHKVPKRVTTGVIHIFEKIKIEKKNRDGCIIATGKGYFSGQTLLKIFMVVQPGQAVTDGTLLKLEVLLLDSCCCKSQLLQEPAVAVWHQAQERLSPLPAIPPA